MKSTEAAEPQEPATLDPESRLIELKRLSEEDPAGRWFLPLGALLLELDQITEAQRTVRQGLAQDPDCLSGWVLLGRSYWMGGEAAAARRIMASVLARDPENAHALRVRAQAEMHLGESGAAMRDYRALLRLVPGDVAAQDALAQLLDHDTEILSPGDLPPVPVLAGNSTNVLLPPTEPMAPRSRGAAPKAGLPKPKRRTKERTLPSPAKVEARRRPPAASAGRTMLPPARRPKSGIFESLPGDLDWPRKRASRPPGPENAPPPAAGPEPQRQGYRRWLDRLIADEHDGGPEPDSGTG